MRFVSLPPNAVGGNYEYFAIVNNSLTKTNLARWEVGVEQKKGGAAPLPFVSCIFYGVMEYQNLE